MPSSYNVAGSAMTMSGRETDPKRRTDVELAKGVILDFKISKI